MLVKNENTIMRTVHGSIFLIDISDNYAGDKCALYEINETGKFIWDSLDSCATVEALTTRLKAAIIDDIPYAVLQEDVADYINDLREKRFILEVESDG